MAKLESGLTVGTKSPNEQVVKNRLREVSGIAEAKRNETRKLTVGRE
jgi:hypothetical protein